MNGTKKISAETLYHHSARSLDGTMIPFEIFKGKKLLIVNTASECGFTSQLKDLEKLYRKYKEKNFEIIAFPSNDFGRQEPGDSAAIGTFCENNFGVTFRLMEKISIKNERMHPVYQWLTMRSRNGVKSSKVRWNFQKYMVDENGQLVDYVNAWRKPHCSRILRWLNR